MWSDSDDGSRELRTRDPPPAPSPGPAAGRHQLREPSGPAAAALAAAATAGAPNIAQLNVSKNSRMHVGPKFVSVTQNVHNTEMVKEVGLARYVWEWVRRTSRAERLACLAALGVLVLCAALAGLLAAPRSPPPQPDVAQREWNVSREQWLAKPARGDHVPWAERFEPLRLVVVQHTVGPECFRLADCAATMRNLQLYYFKEFGYDVPYNFVVGNDGRVYEAHGWGEMGAHTRGYNPCALGLGFTGDYTPTGGARPTELQLNRTLRLLEGGMAAGQLHARYLVLAARDVQSTASPGELLYAALRHLPNFSADPQRFRNRTCDDIYAELRAEDPPRR